MTTRYMVEVAWVFGKTEPRLGSWRHYGDFKDRAAALETAWRLANKPVPSPYVPGRGLRPQAARVIQVETTLVRDFAPNLGAPEQRVAEV